MLSLLKRLGQTVNKCSWMGGGRGPRVLLPALGLFLLRPSSWKNTPGWNPLFQNMSNIQYKNIFTWNSITFNLQTLLVSKSSNPFFCNTGAILTFLVSLVRYILARKSCKNIHPPNKQVLKWSIGSFFFLFSAISLYFVTSELLDLPFALVIEACSRGDREPREISKIRRMILQSPNYFNFGSILIDLMMFRFLKKTLLPTSTNANFIQLRSSQNENPDEIYKF